MGKFKEDGLTIPSMVEKAEELALTEIWGYKQVEPPEASTLSESPVPPQTSSVLPATSGQASVYQAISSENIAVETAALPVITGPISSTTREESTTAPVDSPDLEAVGEKSTRSRKKKGDKPDNEQLTLF